jgi:patatin-like phospholipase/acyl hydrolase
MGMAASLQKHMQLIIYICRGGVRGIVELVVLEAIMKRVGHNLPVQELFDVIMGTSTGKCNTSVRSPGIS